MFFSFIILIEYSRNNQRNGIIIYYYRMEELREEEYEGFNPPKWVWVSVSEGSRDKKEMVNIAFSYSEKENVIRINKDFHGFWDLVYLMQKASLVDDPSIDLFDVLIAAVENDLSDHISMNMWSKPPDSERDYYYIDRDSNELIRKILSPVPSDEELTKVIMADLFDTMKYTLSLRMRATHAY